MNYARMVFVVIAVLILGAMISVKWNDTPEDCYSCDVNLYESVQAPVVAPEPVVVHDTAEMLIRDELVAQGLSEADAEMLLAIAKCESCDPDNGECTQAEKDREQNSTSTAAGRWQIIKGTWEEKGLYDWEDRYDWLANTHTAAQIYKESGTQPWQASASCWS